MSENFAGQAEVAREDKRRQNSWSEILGKAVYSVVSSASGAWVSSWNPQFEVTHRDGLQIVLGGGGDDMELAWYRMWIQEDFYSDDRVDG